MNGKKDISSKDIAFPFQWEAIEIFELNYITSGIKSHWLDSIAKWMSQRKSE